MSNQQQEPLDPNKPIDENAPPVEDPKKNSKKILLFILLVLLGILLAFLIFSLAQKERRIPPRPPRPPRRAPPKQAPSLCANFEDDLDATFGKFKVYVADFQELHESGEFEQTAGAELLKHGWNYKITDDEEEFVSEASAYDIIWIFSANEFDDDEDYQCYLRMLDVLVSAKKPFYIWADNSPYTVHANIFFERYFDGMKISGNYRGTQNLTPTKGTLTAGKFSGNHYPLSCELDDIYEGNTICTATNIHPDFKVFAYNSNFEATILYAEANDRHGRIIVDCGFTKLYKSFWDLAETNQYITNANLWLTGVTK